MPVYVKDGGTWRETSELYVRDATSYTNKTILNGYIKNSGSWEEFYTLFTTTSYSSSIEMLKISNNIYWLLGGIPKKGDKFDLSKIYYKNIRGYIFSKNSKKFLSDLKNKIKLKRFPNLKNALNGIYRDIKLDRSNMKTILFSPAAASFDSFKNFEDRGFYFNKIIKKYFNDK